MTPTPSALTGYVVTWHTASDPLAEIDGRREQFTRGAFTRALADPEADVPCYPDHDEAQPLGSTRGGTLLLAEDAIGLWFRLDSAAAVDLYRAGNLTGVSFRFAAVRERTEADVRTVAAARLREISLVTWPRFPAYRSTSDHLRLVPVSLSWSA